MSKTVDNAIEKFEKKKSSHLRTAIILDAIGMLSYVVPVGAEVIDVVYAPIFGLAVYSMFKIRGGAAKFAGWFGFTEEAIPGLTDFIPTASLMWVYTYKLKHDSTYDKFMKQEAKDRARAEHYLVAKKKEPNLLKRMWSSIAGVFSPSSRKLPAEVDAYNGSEGGYLPPSDEDVYSPRTRDRSRT